MQRVQGPESVRHACTRPMNQAGRGETPFAPNHTLRWGVEFREGHGTLGPDLSLTVHQLDA